ESKLLTTAVFREVRAQIYGLGDDDTAEYYLSITVVEKLTVIPVIRAVVGGGTPLKVAGIYDTHAFGSLWTLGGEARQYGDAAPGGVIWARAPRWRQGYHVLGTELWRDNRQRLIFDHNGTADWRFTSQSTMLRVLYGTPLLDRRTN